MQKITNVEICAYRFFAAWPQKCCVPLCRNIRWRVSANFAGGCNLKEADRRRGDSRQCDRLQMIVCWNDPRGVHLFAIFVVVTTSAYARTTKNFEWIHMWPWNLDRYTVRYKSDVISPDACLETLRCAPRKPSNGKIHTVILIAFSLMIADMVGITTGKVSSEHGSK